MIKLKSALINIMDFMTLIVMALLLPVWLLIGAVMKALGKEQISLFGWDMSIKG